MSASPAAEVKQPADVKVLTRLDLVHDMAAMAGKELKLQRTVYAPGACGTPHSHEGKVEVVLTVSGSIVEHHRDGRTITYNAGDAFTANKDTFHHLENRGSAPAELLVAMIADKA